MRCRGPRPGRKTVKRVAYLNGASWRGGPLEEGELPIPEQGDFALIRAAGQAVGLQFEIRRWDDPEVRGGAGFDAALIRSCWDYPERPAAFLAALQTIESSDLPVFNSAAIVAWNARKTYLRDFTAAGVPGIDTIWLDAVTPQAVGRAFSDFDAAEIVLKPQIGAGSRRTIRLKRNGWSDADLIAGPDGPAMAQPFLPAIETEGEFSLFLFGGRLAHAIQKTPAPGSWYANVADPTFTAIEPSAEMLVLGEATIAAAPKGMLYARVDAVRGLDGRLALIELEAIEPYLFLSFAPRAADLFAGALADALA
jgi:glutathione synthase/RimK-type ligase-like ATP-grasp enzyme